MIDGVYQTTLRHRVLAPDVGETLCGSGGEPGDGHRLDYSERVALHQDPVLEGARLRLVAVGDDVFLIAPGVGDSAPLDPDGECCATATLETRFVEGGDQTIPPHDDRLFQAGIAAAVPVGIEALRVDMSDTTEQTQLLSALMDQTRGKLVEGETSEARRLGGSDIAVAGACVVDEGRRSPVALAETGAWRPTDSGIGGAGPAQLIFERSLQLVGPIASADDVVADVDQGRRS